MVELPGRRGITPAFGYTAPHPGGRGTSTLRIKTLPSTHYGRSDSCPAALRILIRDNELRLDPGRSPCFTASNLPIIPSPTTPCRPDASLGFATSGLPDHTPRRGPPFGGRA